MERSLILLKPDAVQRNLLGEILHRFERKGLKVIGLKMLRLDDALLDEHYAHHKDKDFFLDLKRFMKSAPVAAIVLEGMNAITSIRLIVGPTKGHEADAGTIRGDFSLSGSANLVHASDSPETAEQEIRRFFVPDELFEYDKVDSGYIVG
ncbi:MAG: nucleoside-diphosphate kinase [Candidatus Kerfeldbacteria bacterium]|nr:nucleoside-diphosphate kinase [Candidatus Kerfeldbacteria bacterium]